MSRTRLLSATLGGVLLATSSGICAQEFEHDADRPIEITADSLEVVQADRIATFAGNVDAVQGDLVLSADELKVHYRGGGEEEEPAAPGATGTIRRIEAFGNVVMSSPRETARGEVGVYDVGARLVTLDGSVVLTRDENVIRGDRLELDLATGVSRVIATTTAAQGAAPEQRVRAVFTPGAGDRKQSGDAGSGGGATARGAGGGGQPAKPEAGAAQPRAPVPAGKPPSAPADGG
ncbi:MAG TPA: LptA/OstA family protein [Geminicoccaceae bacterium]